jgi:hypothetical protein
MDSSMADYLKVVTPYLHSELISPSSSFHLQALARVLPPFSSAMLEFRLGTGESQTDLSVFFSRRTLNLPETLLNHPVWQGLHNFSQEYVNPESWLHHCLRSIALEFDLDGHPSEIPIPCIFLAWNQGAVDDAQALIRMALALPNYPISSRLQSNLRLCVDSLPHGAKVEHIGAMLSRPGKVLRVIVGGIPPQQFSDYLMQIGWRESTETISTLVSNLYGLVDKIYVLSFDIGDVIYPRVGLEFFLKKQPEHEPRWELFLDRLIEMGLCTPAKKNALLAWPGISQKADNPELWPQNLSRADRLLSFRASSVFWRTISHVKIVYQPDSPLEAKGYITFGHQWIDASTVTTSC